MVPFLTASTTPTSPSAPKKTIHDQTVQAFHRTMYGLPIKQKFAAVRSFIEKHGESMKAVPELGDSITRLKQLQIELAACMDRLNMGRHCAACGSRSGGGCCSLYMADENDGFQLMLNWLAGCSIDAPRDDGVECCFLGPEGCSLLFKPMFCLNYNCTPIQDSLTPEDTAALARCTGALLQEQYAAEQLLHSICRTILDENFLGLRS